MENINNLHWKWDKVFTPINELHNRQLRSIYKFLEDKHGLIYNINVPIWRKQIRTLIITNSVIYKLSGGKQLMQNLDKTKHYKRNKRFR